MIKRIETEKDKSQREKKRRLILSVVLIIVMFGSVFGIVVGTFQGVSNGSNIEYNGFIFLNENGFYSTQVGNSKYYFSNNPKDIEKVYAQITLQKSLSDYYNKTLYISSEDYEVISEIQGNFYQYTFGIYEACKEGEECYDETLQKKTCLDNLIIIKKAEENRIYESSGCVYIEGKEKDILTLTDKFMFQVIGID